MAEGAAGGGTVDTSTITTVTEPAPALTERAGPDKVKGERPQPVEQKAERVGPDKVRAAARDGK